MVFGRLLDPNVNPLASLATQQAASRDGAMTDEEKQDERLLLARLRELLLGSQATLGALPPQLPSPPPTGVPVPPQNAGPGEGGTIGPVTPNNPGLTPDRTNMLSAILRGLLDPSQILQAAGPVLGQGGFGGGGGGKLGGAPGGGPGGP